MQDVRLVSVLVIVENHAEAVVKMLVELYGMEVCALARTHFTPAQSD
jgi:hypothetical protein